MRVEILNGLGEVTVLPATRVLIVMDDDTPVAVASEWMAGAATCGHAGEGAKFAKLLTALGIDRTTVTTRVTAKSFDEIGIL